MPAVTGNGGGPWGGRASAVREAALTAFAARGYHGTSMKDIAALAGIQAPSLYNHVESKQQLLRDIMLGTEKDLLAEFQMAMADGGDIVTRLGRAVEVFVCHHARHRREALIGNREVASLDEPARAQLVAMRRSHEHAIRTLIEAGTAAGVFAVARPHLASFAMLEMGVSVARWLTDDGPLSAEEVARHYGEMAVRMCGATPSPSLPRSGQRRASRQVRTERRSISTS